VAAAAVFLLSRLPLMEVRAQVIYFLIARMGPVEAAAVVVVSPLHLSLEPTAATAACMGAAAAAAAEELRLEA
jgi:hypothetical protein